jgi:Transposase DDE domain
MTTAHLYRQMFTQMRQWIDPMDRRHLQGYAEAVSAILQSGSGCPSHWLPYLSHRDCHARSHLERLHYFLRNPSITAETFYVPILQQLLKSWSGQAMTLVLDTSLLWDKYCLIEVCLAWGGRSIVLAQSLLEHGSATVGFEAYCPVLEQAAAVLPRDVQVLFLADRGFEHGALMRWLTAQGWDWAIRAKSDLLVKLNAGTSSNVAQLLPKSGQAHLYPEVQLLGEIDCHLATAHWPDAKEAWAVITNRPPSLQTFAQYGQRFGGIEPHFKDYKSATFDLTRSHIRHPQALACLLMLIAAAQLFAIQIGFATVYIQKLNELDWHLHRGMSFLQLGLRELKRRIYLSLAIPPFKPLPPINPKPATASLKKQAELATRIEFERVQVFVF